MFMHGLVQVSAPMSCICKMNIGLTFTCVYAYVLDFFLVGLRCTRCNDQNMFKVNHWRLGGTSNGISMKMWEQVG